MSTLSYFVLPYNFVPDEAEPSPPIIEVDIRGPLGSTPYNCLLDSGANRSAFPADSITDFGISADDLVKTKLHTAGNLRPGYVLTRPDLIQVEIGEEVIPIQPYFLLHRDDETNTDFEDQGLILGRDFFLGFTEVAFSQANKEVRLRR